MQLRGDDITPGRAALRDFDLAYRRFGSFSTVLPASRKPNPVGCSPDSGGAVRGRLLVGQCQQRTSVLQQTARLLGGLPNLHNPRHSDCKGRTTTGLALDRDVAAHHLAEAFADRQAKARAAIFACRGRGRPGEFLEQLAHLLGRHADAGIRYRERDPVAAALPSLMSGNSDGAFLGQLIGVTHEIEQRLPQPNLVGTHRPDLAVAMDRDLIAVLGCQRFDGLDDLIDHRC
jgi:hypothetical protein